MVSGVVEWVNSFGSADGGPPPPPVAAEEDLWDGSTLARVAACITGDGDGALMSLVSASSQVGNNWVLAQGNVKKLLRVLERFYQSELGKRADFAGVDCAKMTRDRDRTEILKVVELLVGAAVQCDDKAQHIGAIMKLSMDSQADLQQMIQSALAKTTDLAPGSARKSSVHSIADAGVSALVAAEAELAKAHAEISRLEEENEVLLSRAAAAEAAEGGASASARDVERAEEMKLALAEAQVLLEDRAQDIAELRQMLEAAESKVAQESRQRARFEADIRLIRDELDLAQDKAGRLAKAESSVERYKKRIEELSGLKERLAEAEEQSAQYLDQVLNLESETKAIPTLKKKIEQYKDEKVELERKLYQAESSVSLKADEVARLKQELDIALQQKTFFEDEMISMREARGIGRAEEDEDEDGREASAPGLFESSAAQREQLVRLRRENELLKVKVGSSGGSDSEEVALLQNQLEDALRVKEERMADAMAAKRTAAEMEMQMHKLREHVKALEGSKSASQQMKDDSRMADLLAQVRLFALVQTVWIIFIRG
jgi:DNA repair exonuclease SbcCD ATPase subunit